MSETERQESIDLSDSPKAMPQGKSESFMELIKNTRIYKILLAVFGVIIFVLLVVILVLLFGRGEIDPATDGACHSDDCDKTASYLYSNMNLTVNACDNFYDYACGNWKYNNPRPLYKDEWGVNTIVADFMNEKIIEILTPEADEKVPYAVSKAQSFYKACMNDEYRDEYGRETLNNVVRNIGNIPMLSNNWNEEKFSWEDVFVYCDLHLNSLQAFLNYRIERIDPKDLNNVIELKMPQSYFIAPVLNRSEFNGTVKQRIINIFTDKVIEAMKFLNSDVSTDIIEKDAQDIINLEKKLYALGMLSAQQDSGKYFKIKLSVLDNKTESMNYTKLFNLIFKSVNITVSPDEPLWTKNPTYFKMLGKIIEETSKRTLANYMGYEIIKDFGYKVVPNFGSQREISKEKLTKDCLDSTQQFFAVAINYWFVKNFYGKRMINQISSYLREIKNSLTLTIQTNRWMDDDTRLEAQRKLNAMIDYIATSQNIKTDKDLNNYYDKTGYVSSENYPIAYKKMSKWIKFDELSKLRNHDRNKIMTPSTVNAFYSHSENKIKILTGFLTPPNFYPSSPVSVNMAAIGSTIGHEMTHGFDTTGSKYDFKGYNKNWWGDRTLERYKEKVSCFINEYSNFTEPETGLNVNGKLTIAENIADNGAVRQAFTAYKMFASLKKPEEDLKLPYPMDLFTKDQLFFIAYANTFCNDNSKEWIMDGIYKDEHAPDIARVNVPLQNSREFAKAFHCKVGTIMNPEKKCILW